MSAPHGGPRRGREPRLPEAGGTRGWALFVHTLPEADARSAEAIEKALAREGIGVMPLPLPGPAGDGTPAAQALATAVDDMLRAGAEMRADGRAPALLVGHGLGGAAALVAAASLPEVAAVATIFAPTDGEQRVREGARALHRPLLVLHGSADRQVPVDHAARIYRAARDPKSFISLGEADHRLSDPRAAANAGAVIAAWMSGYLAAPEEPRIAATGTHGMEVVVSTGTEHYRTEISARGHTLLADEPAKLGGGDTGPDPYSFLLAALGACTSITLRMYADRKGWPLERTTVRLSQAREHLPDSAECPGRPARTYRITRSLELEGDLDPEQRLRLLEIADRCPVHRTLEAGVLTESVLLPEKQKAGTAPS